MIFRSKAWIGLQPTRGPGVGIRLVEDVPYGPNPGQEADLYLPEQKGFPVLVFVHGGGWISEDKIYFGVVGRYLAENGVGAVLINYRLPPAANCEVELRDVAAGFAWTRQHAAELGGDPGRLFLGGHSAGGHLVTAVAANPKYLAAEGLTLEDLRGVVAFSGFYRIRANVRVMGVEYVFHDVDKKEVSPVDIIQPGLPPFLLFCGSHEAFWLRQPTRVLQRKLLDVGGQCEVLVVPGEKHYGEVLHIDRPGSPQGPRLLEFIRGH
jgi:acetyl esterase/lipase